MSVAAERPRDRHSVVAVADEVELADAEQVDRRERLAAARGGRDLLPAPAGASRGRAEAAIVVAAAVDRADDRVERHDGEPNPSAR